MDVLPKLLDLASNFNVDLSRYLSDYSEKLRDDNPGFNFAQAALLIQEATEIYGRKVDYVHSIVLELSETINRHVYSNPTVVDNQNVEDFATQSPKKSVAPRRRRTIPHMTTEDFERVFVSLENPKVINKNKRKKRRKLCKEAICVGLLNIHVQGKKEFHIYENGENNLSNSIGTKDQFRVTWHLHQNCRLEESLVSNLELMNRDPDTFTDGKNLMTPTPVHEEREFVDSCISDELLGIGILSPGDEICIPMVSVNGVIEQENVVKRKSGEDEGSNLNPVPSGEKNQIEKRQQSQKSTFKLPFELTKQGIRNAPPESNFTLFLFSNMLKRTLKMKSSLPPISSGKDGDKKLIAKHVQFLIKRYNLDNRPVLSRKSLIERQQDFLGFDDVCLVEEAGLDILTGCSDINVNEGPLESAAHTLPVDSSRLSGEEADNGRCEPIELFVPGDMPAINDINRRKNSHDSIVEWRKEMQEKLVNQRKDFDVHTYGTDILSAFQSIGETLSFGQVAGGLSMGEISRYFLSTLMLANTSNIVICDQGEPNTLQFTLQNLNRCNLVEERLVPPSVGRDTSSTSHALTPVSTSGSGDIISTDSTSLKSHSKRKALVTPDAGSTPKRRFVKQLPGVGPWKNKSKKA